jgi:hypothetical protein
MSMNRPWGEIRQFYASFDVSPAKSMLAFVSAIEASRYAGGLHAWTSHLDLCITQRPVEHPYVGPMLRVAPDNLGSIEFRYTDTYIKGDQWHRTVAASEAFSRLERFLEQLHWFTLEPVKLCRE